MAANAPVHQGRTKSGASRPNLGRGITGITLHELIVVRFIACNESDFRVAAGTGRCCLAGRGMQGVKDKLITNYL